MNELIYRLVIYLIFLIVICLHELAHGYAAYVCGDDTARFHGRLTSNPLAHIDIIGTVILPLSLILFTNGLAIIGWAKPMPINYSLIRRKKYAEVFIHLAGPIFNFLLAMLTTFAGCIFFKLYGTGYSQLFAIFILINVCFATFNLIPLPPLDAAILLKKFFNLSEEAFFKLSTYSFFIIIIMLNIPLFRSIFSFFILKFFLLVTYLPCYLFNVDQALFLPM